MHVWHVNASGRSSVKLLHGVIDVGDIAFICPTYSAHESTSGWFGSATTKGQLISEDLFLVFDSSKKRTKNFCPSS